MNNCFVGAWGTGWSDEEGSFGTLQEGGRCQSRLEANATDLPEEGKNDHNRLNREVVYIGFRLLAWKNWILAQWCLFNITILSSDN